MAEGWARKWLTDQIETLNSTLQKETQQCDDDHDNKETNDFSNSIQERITMLKNTIVASVALDSVSVFERTRDVPSTCVSTKNSNVCFLRKSIKSKAVEAMKMDGVDIASYQPKTVDEIIHVIRNDGIKLSENPPLQPSIQSRTLVTQSDKSVEEISPLKTVDKLIVMCSCGVLDETLVQRSKSIEEWDIDAPTAASKTAEGDAAYRRVSQQIKNEVNSLMNMFLGNSFL